MDIGVWGDSITYGSSDSEGLGWVGRLRKLHSPEKDEDVVYNRGICGDTSRGLLRRFTSELNSFVYPIDLVLIAIGMNDIVERDGTRNEVPIEEFEDNTRKLITQAAESASSVVVIGITNVDESRTTPLRSSSTGKVYKNEAIQAYNAVLKAVCEECGALFIDVFGTLLAEDLADGLHPNANGYEKLSSVIGKEIDALRRQAY